MPICYQLVGVPGAGKSTWIESQEWAKSIPVVSTDNKVEEYAELVGKTYNDVFKEFMPTAVKLMCQDVFYYKKKKTDIIWDQTSVSVSSREKKFKMLPNYEHIAVVFRTPNPTEHKRRLDLRKNKHIPDYVIESMLASWEEPSLEEGFKDIWYI